MPTALCHPKDGCQDGDGFDGASFHYLSANVLRQPTAVQLRAVVRYNARQKARLQAHARFGRTHRRATTCTRPFRVRLRPKPTAQPLFRPYEVRTVGGVRVGFIGETLVGTPQIVVPPVSGG